MVSITRASSRGIATAERGDAVGRGVHAHAGRVTRQGRRCCCRRAARGGGSTARQSRSPACTACDVRTRARQPRMRRMLRVVSVSGRAGLAGGPLSTACPVAARTEAPCQAQGCATEQMRRSVCHAIGRPASAHDAKTPSPQHRAAMALVCTGRRVPVERWVTAPPVNEELSEGVRHHSDVRKRHGLRTIHQADQDHRDKGSHKSCGTCAGYCAAILCRGTVQQHCMRVSAFPMHRQAHW